MTNNITPGAVLEGEELLVARRVVSWRIVCEAESMGCGDADLDVILTLRDLGRIIATTGFVGDPPDGAWRPGGRAELSAEDVDALITAARWEDVLATDHAENTWTGHSPENERARLHYRERAADARRVLEVLGVERGNPAGLPLAEVSQ